MANRARFYRDGCAAVIVSQRVQYIRIIRNRYLRVTFIAGVFLRGIVNPVIRRNTVTDSAFDGTGGMVRQH